MRTPYARPAAVRVAAFAAFPGFPLLALAGLSAFVLFPALADVAALDAQPPPVSVAPGAITRDSVARALDALRASHTELALPPAERFTIGDATIAPRTTAAGPIAVAGGTLHVRGRVDGDVVTYRGDIVVHEGGDVRGNALAIDGRVAFDGGRVTGEARSLSGDLSAAVTAVAQRSVQSGLFHEVSLAGGWLGVLMIVGIGVLVFASRNLAAVADALERDFGRAFLAGVAAEFALLPGLVVVVIALALTVIGVLLIPFAIVAYVLAAAGLVTLGYLAIASITGRTFVRPIDESERHRRVAALKGMLLGLLIVMAPWLVAAILSWTPTGVVIARAIAIGITWVACTAGLGAALLSRGGVRQPSARAAQQAIASSSWQTPTPVSGVSAARRPTPVAAPSTPGPR